MASKNDPGAPTGEKDTEKDIEKDIGETIVRLRRAAHMTQEDLAGAAEMDRSYLSEIENGRKNLSVRILKKIADALNTDITEFFRRS